MASLDACVAGERRGMLLGLYDVMTGGVLCLMVCRDGQTYSRASIEGWFAARQKREWLPLSCGVECC